MLQSRTFFLTLAGLSALLGVSPMAHAQNLFVANYGNIIGEYSPTGILLQTITSGVQVPSGLACNSNGNLFVANYDDNTIEEYSSTGTDLGVFISTGLDFPQGLAFNSNGDLFVANQGSNTIGEYSPTGNLLQTITSGVGFPFGLALNSSDDLFVANFLNNSIEEYSPTGTDLGVYNSPRNLDRRLSYVAVS